MAADDAKADDERVTSPSTTETSSIGYQFDDADDEPLAPLPAVPPMPSRSAAPSVIAPKVQHRAVADVVVRKQAPNKTVSAEAPAKSGSREPPVAQAASARIKGWVTLDADMVFRGWAMKVGACEDKLEVALYLDNELVARSVAEDFRQDLPCDDKRHGFKFVVPDRFIDSTEHVWVVHAGDDGFKLSSTTTTFLLEPDAIPTITIDRIAPDMMSGTIEAAKLVKCGNPNVWVGADRLVIPDEAGVWNTHGRKGGYPFDIPISEDQFHAVLSSGLRVSIPGDRVGERAIEIAPPVIWEFRNERLIVSIGAPFEFPGNTFVPLAVSPTGGETMVAERLRFSGDGVAEYRPPSRFLDDGFEARLGHGNPELTASAAQFSLGGGLGGVVANWDFGWWRDGAPAEWRLAEGLPVERRITPSTRTQMFGVAEDTALLWTGAAQQGEVKLLHQTLTAPIESRAFVGIIARAAQKCQVEIVLVGEGARPITRLPVALTREWQRVVLEIAPGNDPARALELRFATRGAPWIEVAGFDLAPDAGFLFRPASSAEPTEIVINPDLQGWAPQEYPLVCEKRTELARGWWVSGAKDTRLLAYPVPLALVASGSALGKFALSVASDAAGKFARIETRLDKHGFQARQPYTLTFQASATSPIDGSPLPRHRKWPILDRIFVMARDSQTDVGRFIFDCARRIYLSPSRGQVSVTFEVAESTVEAIADSAEELFLVLEFHSAFQVTIDSFSISEVGATAGAVAGRAIALEDRDIIAQAAHTKGCEHWILPTAQKWNGDVEGHAQPAVEQSRWTWRYRDLGTIEVVICVYNAIDETLQCLRSLAQSTSVPHTVSIVDDGSSANGVARIEAFISDKPWMRLHRNPVNKGYTRSADFGIRSAGADWVVLLNSDTIVSAGWLEGMLEVAASDPRISLVGPVSNAASFQSVPDLYDAAGQWSTNELPAGLAIAEMAELVGRVSPKEFPRVPLLNGFCTLLRRSVFEEIGGLDATAFPMGYGEENDMCLRARDQGHELAVADHVYVHHIKSASFGKAKRTELSKAGNQRLREKHPTVDFGRLVRDFAEVSALVTLRQRVRDALAKRQTDAGNAS